MEKIIFKNETIEVIFRSTDSKGILVNAKAINPKNGQEYERSAGWLSSTWYLHSFSKTPAYVFEAASKELHENIFIIAEKILSHIVNMHDLFIANWNEKEYSSDYKNPQDFLIEYKGRVEPKYGMADIYRNYYKTRRENLELIQRERESSEFKKMKNGVFNNNKRRVSR